MTVYVQTDATTNKITDVITYAHDGYTAVEATIPLPVGVMGGAYELRDGSILYRSDWDTYSEVEALKQTITDLQLAMTEIYEGGVTVG